MKIDYYEAETDGETQVAQVGVQFEDEPDALYVAELKMIGGVARTWTLYYNGFDCSYAFRREEQEQLCAYLNEKGVAVRLAERDEG
ncbi:hypothetical protein B5M42_018060 [Paenibacillus athensensis]|uniref:Phage protein n=1 Tax=Paenibacillus athensensis TaxID=1967502 RepID=A0A4Y8Q1C9_9BACL|nr:hypothetical protein [Paenibacillus athensensis]MCD1260709.1 hypothetical protein [Paenibacillus athensensis]